MKKISSFIITTLFMLSIFILPASANFNDIPQEDVDDIVISEYDQILEYRNTSDVELEEMGLSAEDIELIKSDAVENELLYRRGLSDDVLKGQYCYTDEQIAILRDYDGCALEDDANLTALTGTLTLNPPSINSSTSDGIAIMFSWSWDSMPAITKTDAIAVSWNPTFGHDNGNFRVTSSECYNVVSYYLDGQPQVEQFSFTTETTGYGTKTTFPLIKYYSGLTFWAKSGLSSIAIARTSGSADWTEVDFLIKYAHATIELVPTISFPFAGGISVGSLSTTAGIQEGYILPNSYTWHKN